MDLPQKLRTTNRDFSASEVGEFNGLVSRTVNGWCSKGLILSFSSGKGDRRRFTVLQVVEAAIIKAMSDSGLPLARIRMVMEFLRDYDLLSLLSNQNIHVAVAPIGDDSPKIISNVTKADDFQKARLLDVLFQMESSRFFVFDLKAIAVAVLDGV